MKSEWWRQTDIDKHDLRLKWSMPYDINLWHIYYCVVIFFFSFSFFFVFLKWNRWLLTLPTLPTLPYLLFYATYLQYRNETWMLLIFVSWSTSFWINYYFNKNNPMTLNKTVEVVDLKYNSAIHEAVSIYLWKFLHLLVS